VNTVLSVIRLHSVLNSLVASVAVIRLQLVNWC